MGAPTKYKDTYPEELIKLMSEGKLNCQVFSAWGIHKDTFYQWMYDHPELKEAYEIGKPQCESWWIDWGMKGMQGLVPKFNFNTWVAFMNNKFGWVPGNKQPGEATNQTINIGNLNVLQNQNNTQLLEYIKTMSIKHKDILDVELIEAVQETKDNERAD